MRPTLTARGRRVLEQLQSEGGNVTPTRAHELRMPKAVVEELAQLELVQFDELAEVLELTPQGLEQLGYA